MTDGESLKRDGMAAVMAATPADWKPGATAVLGTMKGEFTGEDVRLACRGLGILPHHPNAWGAFINGAIRSGWIEPTGAYRKPRDRRSHARMIQVYRWRKAS